MLLAAPAVPDEHGAVVPVALRMLLAVQADAGEAPGAAQDGVRGSPLAPPAHPVCVPAPCDRALSAAVTRSLSCSELPAQPCSQLSVSRQVVSRQVRVQLHDPSSRLPRSYQCLHKARACCTCRPGPGHRTLARRPSVQPQARPAAPRCRRRARRCQAVACATRSQEGDPALPLRVRSALRLMSRCHCC